MFEAKKSVGDYHEEMDGPRFEAWWKVILPKLEPNSTIIIDNAPYHTVVVEKFPTTAWRKDDLQNWLKSKNVDFEPKMTKAELMVIINPLKPRFKTYRVDEMAKAAGHVVLRLPPYHCELNPIELVWSQVKRYVASNNTTFKMDDVKRLVHESFAKIADGSLGQSGVVGDDPEAKLWFNCVRHVIAEEGRMWDIDGTTDQMVDKMIIAIGPNDSSTDDSETDLINSADEDFSD